MSFAVSQLPCFKENSTIRSYSPGLDVILVASIVTVASLILAGVIRVGLPSQVGTIGYPVVGLAALIIMVDGVALLLSKSEKKKSQTPIREYSLIEVESKNFEKKGNREEIISDVQKIIRDLPIIVPDSHSRRVAENSPSNQVLNELFLGSASGFGLAYEKETEFKALITLCPFNELLMKIGLYGEKEVFIVALKEKGVEWHFLGRTWPDQDESWKLMIHDCSFPDSEEAKKMLPMEEQEFITLNENKIKRLEIITSDLWFEPVFQEIDKAVFGTTKTLVHCQAGVSRSATVLAAYFIKRFDVTADQAVNFLRSRRACVDPKFMTHLRAYEQILRESKKS